MHRSRSPASVAIKAPISDIGGISDHGRVICRRTRLKQIDDLVEAELEGLLAHATLDSLFGEFAFLLLQFEDALLDCLGDGELVDDYVDRLCETMDTVDGLFFNKLDEFISKSVHWRTTEGNAYWIPERLENDHSGRCCQVKS